MNQLNKLKVLALSLWVSGLFIIGGLVAPVLFYWSGLSTTTAGMIAGRCFGIQSTLNLVCAVIILIAMFSERGTRLVRSPGFWVLLIMILCVIINQYSITPIIEQIKSNMTPDLGGHYGTAFAKWHGISSSLYWFQAVLGVALLWKHIPDKSRQWSLFTN